MCTRMNKMSTGVKCKPQDWISVNAPILSILVLLRPRELVFKFTLISFSSIFFPVFVGSGNRINGGTDDVLSMSYTPNNR